MSYEWESKEKIWLKTQTSDNVVAKKPTTVTPGRLLLRRYTQIRVSHICFFSLSFVVVYLLKFFYFIFYFMLNDAFVIWLLLFICLKMGFEFIEACHKLKHVACYKKMKRLSAETCTYLLYKWAKFHFLSFA